MSTSRSLVGTNVLVGVALVIGLANNVAIAAIFGLTRRVDAFYAAQTLPNLFMALSMDYLGRNFLPVFARARRQSEAFASELASSIVTAVCLLSLFIAFALAWFSGHVFDLLLPGFDSADVALVGRYFWIMSPAIVLMAVTVFHQYICQHDEDYVYVMAVQIALPLGNLVAIVGAGRVLGEYALPVGYLLGNLVVFVLMARRARYRYRIRIVMRKEWEGKILSNSAIVMGSGLVARTRGLITNYVGSLLGPGAISALAMSTRLTEPVGRTVFTALKMMMFSRAARLAVDGNSKEIARLYDLGLGAVFMLLTPLVWWMGLNAPVIVNVLFMRGRFDPHMAELVSLALIGALPSVVFVETNTVLSNAFYALERVAVPALVMPLATLSYLLVAPRLAGSYGIFGLTASSSAISIAIFVALTSLLARKIPHFSALLAYRHLIRYTLAAGVCALLSSALLGFLDLPETVGSAVGLCGGLALYVLVLWSTGDKTLEVVYRLALKAMPLPRRAHDAVN